MIVSSPAKYTKEDERKFHEVEKVFFGMNPTSPYWILLAFYFAKNRKLRLCDNYSGEGIVLATITTELIGDHDKLVEWYEKGIVSRSVVAYANDQERKISEAILQPREDEFDSRSNISLRLSDFKQMEPTYLVDVAENLIGISDAWYASCSQDAFLQLYFRSQSPTKSKGGYFQPKELTNLVVKILDAHKGTVYNPYAGLCAYGAYLPSDNLYFAQEISQDWTVAQLFLWLNDKPNSLCVNQNSIKEWSAAELPFDFIVSTPPIGKHHDSQLGYTDLDYFVRSACYAQKKAVGIYREIVCFGKGSKTSERLIHVIQKDWIESVIQLPISKQQPTNYSSVIVVVNKNKERKGIVRLIDASDCFNQDLYCINESEIWDLYCSHNESSRSIEVDLKTIENNWYCIYPKYYINKVDAINEDGFKAVSLKAIIKADDASTNLGTPNESWKMFSFGMPPKGYNQGILTGDQLPDYDGKWRNLKPINKDCLIVSTKRKMRPAYLKAEGNIILVPTTYNFFSVDTKKVLPLYLVGEMSKKYFIDQIERYGCGQQEIGRFMTPDEFLECKIYLPSIEEQRERIYISKSVQLQELEYEIQNAHKKQLEDFIIGQRERKHAVAQVLNEIVPSIEMIESFVQNHETISKDDIISRRRGVTFAEYVSNLKTQISKVVDMVGNFTNREKYGEPEDLDLYTFLEDYCNSKKSDVYQAIYEHEEEELDEDEEPSKFLVRISKNDFTQILDNIFTNAQKHGFVDATRKDYKIKIEPIRNFEKSPVAIIRILNNGEPVSKTISPEKIFTWGEGRGTGIGCWQVKDIAEHFDGEAHFKELHDDPRGYTVEFTIVLPLVES